MRRMSSFSQGLHRVRPAQGQSITGTFGTSNSWSAPLTISGIEVSGLTTGRLCHNVWPGRASVYKELECGRLFNLLLSQRRSDCPRCFHFQSFSDRTHERRD
jgi:hypothetical protein